MKANLWNSLEILSTQAALLTEWRESLGEDFACARVFLRPTRQQTDSYPCVHRAPCGCRHRVVFESEENVSAVCECEEAGCDVIYLRAEDLTVYALDVQAVAAALCEAFQFQKMETPALGEVRSSPVGCWGLRRSCVFFFVPMSEKGLLHEIDRLCTASFDPFVLLMPTSRFCTPLVQRALRRCGAAQIVLAGILTLPAPGQLKLAPSAKESVEAILGDFGRRVSEGTPLERAIARVEAKLNVLAKSQPEKEEPSEEIARQAMAMVKQLESGRPVKPPSFITVFRLYCIEAMSAAEIAAHCGCSKTTVIERLQALAKRIGVPPIRLRQYSAQFERMEESLEDGRAKRIDRQELANGPVADDEI